MCDVHEARRGGGGGSGGETRVIRMAWVLGRVGGSRLLFILYMASTVWADGHGVNFCKYERNCSLVYHSYIQTIIRIGLGCS